MFMYIFIQYIHVKYAGLSLNALLYSITYGSDPSIILCLLIAGVIMVRIKAQIIVTLDGIFGAGSYGYLSSVIDTILYWEPVPKIRRFESSPYANFLSFWSYLNTEYLFKYSNDWRNILKVILCWLDISINSFNGSNKE